MVLFVYVLLFRDFCFLMFCLHIYLEYLLSWLRVSWSVGMPLLLMVMSDAGDMAVHLRFSGREINKLLTGQAMKNYL